MLEAVLKEFTAYRWFEVVAVALAVAYIVLAAIPSIWCWSAGILSSLIFAIVLGNVQLYLDSVLNLFYVVMGIVGWVRWHKKDTAGPIKSKGWKFHLTVLGGGALLTLLAGMASEKFGNALPYWDAFTTVFSVITTFMLIQKVVENWLYWMVIDAVAAYVYYLKGLPFTMVLFVAYFFLAFVAWWRWNQQMKLAPQV
ncbi:MAG: nicotinamide riboside transporter PnuC [Salibacteraceae bacterium]